MGEERLHRTNKNLNKNIEQEHRGIKQRYGPIKGFASFDTADRFCKANDELRNYYKSTQRGQETSLRDQRLEYMMKTQNLTDALMTA